MDLMFKTIQNTVSPRVELSNNLITPHKIDELMEVRSVDRNRASKITFQLKHPVTSWSPDSLSEEDSFKDQKISFYKEEECEMSPNPPALKVKNLKRDKRRALRASVQFQNSQDPEE